MGMNKCKLTAICAVSLLCTNLSYAERSGFYTIIDPDGRVMVIDRAATDNKKVSPVKPRAAQAAIPTVEMSSPSGDSAMPQQTIPVKPSSTQPSTPKTSNPNRQLTTQQSVQSKVVAKPVAKPVVKKTDRAVATQDTPSSAGKQSSPLESAQVSPIQQAQQPESTDSSANPVTIIDGEKYIDSEYLEQREFNLEGKKRFYTLPDGTGRAQVVEREKGVDMTAFKPSNIEKPQIVSLAKDYQRLAKDDVVNLIGMQCFSHKQLKKTKLINKSEPLNLWPRPGLEPKFDFVVAEFQEQINDIQVTSYTDSISNPIFYWPLPIFLDASGCVIEGVNSFYQQTIAPSVTTHQAIQGYLHIPAGTKYLVLTPLEAAADLMQIQLTNKGQVRLTPIR